MFVCVCAGRLSPVQTQNHTMTRLLHFVNCEIFDVKNQRSMKGAVRRSLCTVCAYVREDKTIQHHAYCRA